jgi:hypothetical protein
MHETLRPLSKPETAIRRPALMTQRRNFDHRAPEVQRDSGASRRCPENTDRRQEVSPPPWPPSSTRKIPALLRRQISTPA